MTLRAYLFCSVLLAAAASCSDRGDSDSARAPETAAAAADDHDHDHESDEISDLDRPVEELFAAKCEHGIETYRCQECRYEVGVVQAPERLFEGDLLGRTRAEKRPVMAPLRLTGEVRFDERRVAHVGPQAEGTIRNVHVTLGDRVTRGQALVDIESVEIGEAQAAYLEARGMLELARKSHARTELLRKDGISSEKELLRAGQELDAAEIRVDAALGRLTRLGVSAHAAGTLTQKRATGRLVLRAPADGTVLGMHAVPGEIARAGESLVTVGDNQSMWVWADLYERDFARVSAAQSKQPLTAEVSVEAFGDHAFPGTVDFISPAMNESSRTVELRIAVANPDRKLLAGMFAEVKVFLPGDREVLTVPRDAVLDDEGRSFVFVHHHDDYYVRRPVMVAGRSSQQVEVASGLTGDETVVTGGAFLLKSDVLRSKMGAGCAD